MKHFSDTIRSVFTNSEINPVVSLIGPSHAEEVVIRMLTAVCAVSLDEKTAQDVQKLFSNDYLRVYTLTDEIGAEYGAAYKNVIAVASGILKGLGYGDNSRAALITRGLVEMTRLGIAFGATQKSFMGLSGLGDLILTCTDNQSRNRRFGYYLGQGMSAQDALDKIGQVVEGYTMSEVVKGLCEKYNVQMPICSEIYDVLFKGKSGIEAAMALLSREQKAE